MRRDGVVKGWGWASLGLSLVLLAGLGPVRLAAGVEPGTESEAGAASAEAPTTELTKDEREEARTLVAQAGVLRGHAAEGRLFFVAVELLRDKGTSHRLAEVIHYRYEGDTTLLTLVDLTAQKILDVRSESHYPTRLSEEEYAIARALVLADEEVRRALGDRLEAVHLEPMAMRTFVPDDPLHNHRIFRMLFKDGRSYLRSPIVAVDLTTRQVIFEGQRRRPRPDVAPGSRTRGAGPDGGEHHE